MLRHGQSRWNLEGRFTGWWDVDLSEQGKREAQSAGILLRQDGVALDVAYTSVLTRAVKTLYLALEEMDQLWVPVIRHWRLNERHYGNLTGLDKAQTKAKYGDVQFTEWRRSYATAPPPMEAGHEFDVRGDRRYSHLAQDLLPATECLADVVTRMLPYWYDAIAPDVLAGRTVLVTAHGNSLRAMVKMLDNRSEADIVELNIPTGVPLLYELDAKLAPLSSRYLGDPAAIAAAAEAVRRQTEKR